MTIVSELYADTFGSHIGKHSERLKLTKGQDTLCQAPLMHLQSVTIASRGVSISADAIEACCERGIPIYFLDGRGQHYASLFSAGLGGTVLTRRAQLEAFGDERGVHISLSIAEGKIGNQASTLKYVAKSRKEANAELYGALRMASIDVESQLSELGKLRGRTLDDLRGSLMAVEGRAASMYWTALERVVPVEYDWQA